MGFNSGFKVLSSTYSRNINYEYIVWAVIWNQDLSILSRVPQIFLMSLLCTQELPPVVAADADVLCDKPVVVRNTE